MLVTPFYILYKNKKMKELKTSSGLLIVSLLSLTIWLYLQVIELQNNILRLNSQIIDNDKLISLLQLSVKTANDKNLIVNSHLKITENLQAIGQQSIIKESLISTYGKEILLIAVFSLGCLGIYSFITTNSTSLALFTKQADTTRDVGDAVVRNVSEIVINTLTKPDSVLMTKLTATETNNLSSIKTLNTVVVEYCNKILTRIDLLPVNRSTLELSPPPLDILGGVGDLIVNNPNPVVIAETLLTSLP
jgi:hypothetical protein